MAEQFTVKSYAKGVDIAPRKVSVVASLVRNRSVADALVILDHVPRRAGLPIKKAIASAQANVDRLPDRQKASILPSPAARMASRISSTSEGPMP